MGQFALCQEQLSTIIGLLNMAHRSCEDMWLHNFANMILDTLFQTNMYVTDMWPAF